MSCKWDKIIQEINGGENFVIFTHTNMDGDAMGSSSALCLVLRNMGKNAVILLEDKIPDYLYSVHQRSEFFVPSVPYEKYAAIAVDCGDASRIEKRLDAFQKADVRLCIDHHIGGGGFAEYAVEEPESAAAAVLVYQLIRAMNQPMNKEIAENLYMGISTDTGCFKFEKADGKVHEIISDLFSYGIDHVKLCNDIYAAYPLSQLKLEARAVDRAEVFAGGKAVISYILQKDIQELQALYEHVDTCIDRIRCIENTEISCMIKETAEGTLKVSLRSKSYANVNEIAAHFGGGGHIMASGCTLHCTAKEALIQLKAEIEKNLNH